jgi:hypothetical protein
MHRVSCCAVQPRDRLRQPITSYDDEHDFLPGPLPRQTLPNGLTLKRALDVLKRLHL